MKRVQAFYELYDELDEIIRAVNKAKAANDALYNSYFGEYGGNNPCIMTEYEKAGYLHSIVKDYIDQSCKFIQDTINAL